jgi:hypothetical protein
MGILDINGIFGILGILGILIGLVRKFPAQTCQGRKEGGHLCSARARVKIYKTRARM